MIHVYAFTEAGAPLPGVAGIGGAGLRAVAVEDVAAVVGNLEPPAAEREDVIAHGVVVEALRGVADAVLPARFGERFVDEDALADAVAGQLAALRVALGRVRGCVEFGVRMVSEPERQRDGPPARDGSAYMRRRLDSFARAKAIASELHEPLASCARASVVTPGADGHAAAYLVRSEERPAFERALARFMSAHPTATVLCTGPWAPYNFAEAS